MDSYDFKEKQGYRSRVWLEIEKRISKPRALRKVVYLDTREALETVFLLDRGYRPGNLIAINREPVEVALLTQRLDKLGYPRITTAGAEWDRVLSERLAGQRIDILNFDGMGNLSLTLINLLRESLHHVSPTVLAVNMLAGREAGDIKSFLFNDVHGGYVNLLKKLPDNVRTVTGKVVKPSHYRRVVGLISSVTSFSPCLLHVDAMKFDTYLSVSGQPMVWCVVGLSKHRDMSAAKHAEVFAKCIREDRMACLPACVEERYLNRDSDPEYIEVERYVAAKRAERIIPFGRYLR